MDIKLENKSKQSSFIYVLKMILIVLFISFICVWKFSSLVFERFFAENRNDVFLTIYEKVESIESFGINSPEFKNLIDICQANNCIIEVYNTDTNKRIYTPYVYDDNNFSTGNSKQIFDEIIGNYYDVKIISDDDTENQYKINTLNNQNNQYSMLIRKSKDIYILVQTSTESITSYKEVLSKSIIWCFLLALFMGLIPSFLLSKTIIKNINSIKNVAKKISDKDFSEKCEPDKFREFFELANYINKMSGSLETQLKEIENANKILNDDIEKRKVIEQTQKDFVSNVSHELKTPISIISGYTEGIKYGLVSDDDEREKYCDTILDECQRMASIVKQLLDLSVLDNSKLNIEECNLSDMINIIYDKFCNKYSNRKFINDINNNLIGYCDYDEIEKVIINYLENAVKYSNGDVDIRAFLESDYIYIGIHSYSNISDEDMNRIWDRFYRVDKAHKRQNNSTGLGLSIVKATMEKHNMPYGVKRINDGIEFFIKIRKNI